MAGLAVDRPTFARRTSPRRPRAGSSSRPDRTRIAGSTASTTPTSPRSSAKNHELKTGYIGWRDTDETENIGYPNQQQYRYRSVTADANGATKPRTRDGCFARPDSVLLYDYPNITDAGEWYHSGYINDKITLSRKFTLNVGVRYDRYSSFLPEQGNPGTGPWATENIYPVQGRRDFPMYSIVRAARLGRVRRHRRRPHRAARQLRPLRRRQLGRARQSRSGRAANVNPNSIITRTYSGWDGQIPFNPTRRTARASPRRTGGGADRSIDPEHQGTVRR